MEYDYNYENYKALAWCIIGAYIPGKKIKYPDIDTSCNAYRLFDKRNTTGPKKGHRCSINKKKCVLIDLETNKEKVFDSINDVATFTGVKQSAISNAIRMKYKVQKKWLVSLL